MVPRNIFFVDSGVGIFPCRRYVVQLIVVEVDLLTRAPQSLSAVFLGFPFHQGRALR